MIEEIAYWYIGIGDTESKLLTAAIMMAGAILTAFLYRGSFELQRVPCFVYTGAIFAAGGITRTIWIGAWHAVIHGYAALIVAIDVIIVAGTGAAVMIIASARARDAYGSSSAAIMAFVPLLNLVLMLMPSKNRVTAGAYSPLQQGGRAIGHNPGRGAVLCWPACLCDDDANHGRREPAARS